MRTLKLTSLLILLPSLLIATEQKISDFKWGDLDVVWIQDERTPTYALSIYFEDGALSDPSGKSGLTDWALREMTLGSNRYNRREINEKLEFYGTLPSISTTHEYSTMGIGGLVTNLKETMGMVCHLMNGANYPVKELAISKKLYKDKMNSLADNHMALAERAARSIVFQGTPYERPNSGILADVEKITSKDLVAKREMLRTSVKKRIYLAGPEGALTLLKPIIENDCKFSAKNKAPSVSVKITKKEAPQITLVKVSSANQAQVRIGRVLSKEELVSIERLDLLETFLGGNFTSLLMREIRVKRGLSYSAGASASAQLNYGRVTINTFTKNETIGDLLSVLKESLQVTSRSERENFGSVVGYLVGSHPFKFEEMGSYLNQVLYFDHLGVSRDLFQSYPDLVKKLSYDGLLNDLDKLYAWDRLKIVVVGSESLLPVLQKFGEVQVIDYKSFL